MLNYQCALSADPKAGSGWQPLDQKAAGCFLANVSITGSHHRHIHHEVSVSLTVLGPWENNSHSQVYQTMVPVPEPGLY